MKKKIVVATTAAAVAGLALYLAFKQREKKDRKRKSENEEYIANVFSHAKRFEGGEFVL